MSNMGNNMEHNTAKKRRAIELGKDLLILLLCCSALLLAIRGQLFSSAPGCSGARTAGGRSPLWVSRPTPPAPCAWR